VAGVRPGDDVATVSHSFIATANAVVAVGARPSSSTSSPHLQHEPGRARSRHHPRTRAILCVHQIGFSCDLPAILAIAQSRGLPVIEDAACAIGSEIRIDGNWQRIGRPHGLLACFSFHPRKLITTGDGGMITRPTRRWPSACVCCASTPCRPARLAMRATRDLGELLRAGLQFSHDRLAGAVGRPQLARLPAIIASAARSRLATPRRSPTTPCWLRRPSQRGCAATGKAIPPPCEPAGACRRSRSCSSCSTAACQPARYRQRHSEPAYSKCAWSCGPEPCDPAAHAAGRCLRLPVSERARDYTILLPLFHGMSPAEQDYVVATLRALPG